MPLHWLFRQCKFLCKVFQKCHPIHIKSMIKRVVSYTNGQFSEHQDLVSITLHCVISPQFNKIGSFTVHASIKGPLQAMSYNTMGHLDTSKSASVETNKYKALCISRLDYIP